MCFYDSYDALQVLNSDVRLSTAAHNSADFRTSRRRETSSAKRPLTTEATSLTAAIFENYGAQTALNSPARRSM